MSRRCEISGVGKFFGNNVSHSNRRTRAQWQPNIKNKKYLIPELGKSMVLTLTTRTIRSIDKQGGITAALLKAKEGKLSERLLRLRQKIMKQRRKPTAPAVKAAQT